MKPLVLLIAALCPAVFAEDVPLDLDGLQVACERVVGDAEAGFNKRMDARIAQKVEDNPTLSAEGAFRDMALDWFVGNRGALERREPAAIREACLYILRFLRREISLPPLFAERLTAKNVTLLVAALEAKP